MYLFKQISNKVAGLDEAKGVVEAYANVYNVVDSDNDITMPGAFTKTVQEQKKRIRVLKDHNPTQMIGVPLELDAVDSYGLRTVTQFNLQKDLAKDMFTDIQLLLEHDLNAELSIGYEVMKRNKDDNRKIEEFKLYEYSFLTSWAANEMATVQGIKGLSSKQAVIELIVKAYNMDYSDSRLKQIETILKTLDKEPGEPTLDVEPLVTLIDNFRF